MTTERVVRPLAARPLPADERATKRLLVAAAEDFRRMLSDLTTIQIRDAGASEAR